MTAYQARLTDDRDGHLCSRPPGHNTGQGLGIQSDNEWYCGHCHRRVTLSPDGEREYGHDPECDYAIAEVPWDA